ncbi:alpha-N-acetylneuraminide alpha-2,8-sialyltransferase-like [Saccoglossus kowalevskii]|uniref:Alpha-N-acetylneuraminide alpha-2,8-sialyltransferase-like n=1 Tax=Saccoglossus kowalevskii TaxID=10224 RepID=A0ABM0MBK4_SACKO|nr:PREDICTED: alpha-N-acetylneuraminide alpha-2,8-sialyltransferase-like [Saccoglossus kowalevskii]
MVIKTKTRRRVTRSSRTLRRLALQQNLTDTVKLLDTNWELNKTRLRGIRHDLTNLNGSYFIFTQSNTKLGRKYYNSFLKSPVVINRPQLRLLPETSPFSETTLFKSCAIVGNGGILKNSHCGNEIDSSDFVMRSNLQPIKHFTNDAGMKSSLVTINPSIIYNRFNLFDTPGNESNFLQALEEYQQYFLWIPNSYVVNNSLSFETASIIRQTIRQQLLLADAIYFRKLQRYWKTKKMLSTGMSLVSIGICLCEEINLYGFWPFQIDSNGEPLPMHYTDDIAWSTYHHNHDYDSEFQLLINLHRSGVIKLHINQCSP